MSVKKVLLLGASGSIGTQTLDIIREGNGQFELTAFSVGQKAEVIPDLFDFPESIHIVLMKALKETKRDVDFSARIMLAIKIMKLIENNPGITTKQISERIECSDRSTKRYINSLRSAGLMIEYQNRGWSFIMDPLELI